ncbi:hypothetical protein ACA910_006202 [Epithemia clementina (nom. ined.)]
MHGRWEPPSPRPPLSLGCKKWAENAEHKLSGPGHGRVLCGTTPSRPYITVTQTKWDRTKAEIARLRGLINQATMRNGQHQIEHKPKEQVASFLNHIARAFLTIKIYLYGVYATMNSWRPDRDEEGWRIGDYKIECKSQSLQAPKRVRLVKRMIFDVAALESLTESPVPPERVLRPSKHGSRSRYIFADASGAGLGSTDWSPGDDQIQVEYGTWGPEISTGTSSNFRELSNIVLKIEKLDQSGALTELTEVFVFTDNYHAESAFYRGTAKSPEVLSLMHQLYKILIRGRAFIHIVWVAGKRMIDQGTDGLSRSDQTNGVMRGEAMLHFVPLHLTALKRQRESVTNFLHTCFTTDEPMTYLQPGDWFHVPHDQEGFFVWTPPPCLGDIAVQQLAEACHVRPWNTYIFLIPSLMAGTGRKTLYKISDFLDVLPYDKTFWPKLSKYKPLTIAFVFPLLRREPWRVKFSDIQAQRDHSVRTLHQLDFAQAQGYMRQFWLQARSMEPMQKGVSRSLLRRPS